MILIIGLAFLLISIILIKTISSEIKRKKRLEAEEKTIKELEFKENRGWYIKDTVKEQHPSQLENSITKIHPEDMASLLRSWILESSSTVQGMEKVSREFTNRQKLAALLIAMGSKTSVELFKYLRTDELEIIAAEVKKLKQPDLEQEIDILQEFQSHMVKYLGRKK